MAVTKAKAKEAWAHPLPQGYRDAAALAVMTGLLAGASRRSTLDDTGQS